MDSSISDTTKSTHFSTLKQIPLLCKKRDYPHMGDSFHFLDSSRQQAEAQYIFLIHPQEITIYIVLSLYFNISSHQNLLKISFIGSQHHPSFHPTLLTCQQIISWHFSPLSIHIITLSSPHRGYILPATNHLSTAPLPYLPILPSHS